MLGSLTFYRRILKENVFVNPSILAISRTSSRNIAITNQQVEDRLPTIGYVDIEIILPYFAPDCESRGKSATNICFHSREVFTLPSSSV